MPEKTTRGDGHQGVQGTAYDMTKRVGGKTTITNIVRYRAEEVNPPEGVRSEGWIRSGVRR
jgi:branched-chain amino acid transport system substrate-binding protein